jgi:pectate lyase
VNIHQIDDGKRIYLAGRFTDSNNWYGAALYNSGTRKVQIRKKVDGSSDDIASVDHPFELDVWYALSLVLSGPALSVSLDGVPMLDGMDADFSSGTIALLVDSADVAWAN